MELGAPCVQKQVLQGRDSLNWQHKTANKGHNRAEAADDYDGALHKHLSVGVPQGLPRNLLCERPLFDQALRICHLLACILSAEAFCLPAPACLTFGLRPSPPHAVRLSVSVNVFLQRNWPSPGVIDIREPSRKTGQPVSNPKSSPCHHPLRQTLRAGSKGHTTWQLHLVSCPLHFQGSF